MLFSLRASRDRFSSFAFGIGAFVALVALNPRCQAQLVGWTGATDANWMTATNWVSDSPPTDAATVFFDSNATQNLATVNDFPALSLSGLQIFNPSGPVSIGGNGFTLAGSGIDMSLATQSLTIGLTAGQSMTLATGTSQTWAVKQPQMLTVNSPIVGDATTNLKLTGPGGTAALHGIVQLMAGSPNFAGGLEIGGPFMFVVVGADNAFGTGTVFVNSFNTAPQLQASGGTRTIANNMNWNSGFGVGGTNNFIFNGDVKFTNSTGGANRGLTTATAVNITMNGTITMGDPDVTPDNNRSLTITPVVGSTITLSGLMKDPTSTMNTREGFFVKSGAGVGIINNTANTYSGSNQILNGILEIASLADTGSPSSLGTGSTNAEIQFGGTTNTGQLRYNGSANISTNRPLRLIGTSGGGIIENNGTGTMNFTSATFGATGAGSKTFTLMGTNNGANTIAGVITNNSGANTTKVIKSSNGTWVLTGANTYSGGTQIDGGTLRINNSGGSGGGLGTVLINNGGTLAGTGSVSGATTLSTGATLAPGTPETSSGIGTFTINNSLTINGGSIFNFDFGSAGSHDLINVANSVALPASGSVTVNLTNLGGMSAGQYPIIDYGLTSGTLTGTFSTLTLGTQPSGFTYAFLNNTGNTSIDLKVIAPGLLGDFNSDTKVDAADYVTWRLNEGNNVTALPNDNNLGLPIRPAHYDLWRQHFGEPGGGSGSSLGGGAVPEPAGLVLAALGLLVGGMLRNRK